MSRTENQDEPIERLIERSSLGTPGARALKARTPQHQLQLLQRATQLRNDWAHRRYEGLELGRLLEELGALDEAAAFYEAVAAQCLHHLASVRKRQGSDDLAAAWEARAQTLQ